jgi:hypothetical protein
MRIGLVEPAAASSGNATSSQLQRRTRSTMFNSLAFDGMVGIA